MLWLAGTVGVIDDAAALVDLGAVLLDVPFKGGAVAEEIGQHLLLRIVFIRV